MTKVAIRTLDSVTNNDTTATQLINENFQALQTAIENTLSRDGTTPNFMDANLDLNSYKIINAGMPTDNTDVITKEYFDQNVGDAAGYAAAAASSAQQASTFASSASSYAAAATGAANIAQAARDYIESDPGFIAVSTDLQMGVNGSIYKVNANKTNIDTVAGDINRVNLVADDIASVHTVAVGISNIIDVADNKTNIDTVAGSIANVNAVGTDIANVNSVAGDLTNIDTVAGDLTNINTVAGIAGDVSTVAGISSDVAAVKNNATNINAVNANKPNIDTVAGNIATINTVGSDITNVNTVAGDHANIQRVVNNMTAINAAPTYANNARVWAEGVDSEVTPLGGTHSSKGWAEIAEAAASGVQNPANRDLSNLTNTGQLIIDSQNGTISNCILEIPQNIKLTLENNVLTLKSGSILTLTGSTYRTVTATADITWTAPSSDCYGKTCYILATATPNQAGFSARNIIENVTSGSSLPEEVDGHLFYNTTDKLIYQGRDGEWVASSFVYPLGLVEIDESGNISFAKDYNGNDIIFNGAGFIGHHAFVYPGVEGLAPSGFNEDGSLKSKNLKETALQIIELHSAHSISIKSNLQLSNDAGYYEVDSYKDIGTVWSALYYVKDENYIYLHQNQNVIYERCPFISYTYNGTTVTDFTIRQPVRLATTEMLDKKQDTLTFDTTPTQNSTNPVTSGGVYTALGTKQDTLVSGTNIKTINSTTLLGTGNFTLANQSLSNLDSTGNMVIDSQNGTISNCILDIPQNLKLEISGGVVTLKAGSKVVLANGNTYMELSITSDKTIDLSSFSTGKFFLNTDFSGNMARSLVDDSVSGNTRPSTTGFFACEWFDTVNKVIERWNGSSWTNMSYPLCIVDVNNGVASFAKDSNGKDMIFNGAGFIGHHAFVYPNVKALTPAGFNADGSLKSLEATTSELKIYELTTNTNFVSITNGGVSQLRSNYRVVKEKDNVVSCQYVTSENLFYFYTGSVYALRYETPFVFFSYDGTTVSNFAIVQPLRLATTDMLEKVQSQVDTNTTAIAGKQDTLVSGTNIKTINSTSLLGSGDISVADVDLTNINPAASAKSDIVYWGMPDYTSGVSRSVNTDYTETQSGYLIVDYTSVSDVSGFAITIGGTSFSFTQGYSGTDYNHLNIGALPIPKGVTYTITDMIGCQVRFFPCIGG